MDQLEHPAACLGVLLNDLDHAAYFCFQCASVDRGGVKTQNTSAHAVDQLARGVVQVAEKLGLGQCHAQHGHLQPRKPYAHGGGNPVLGQDALEHQGHHFDDGFLASGGRFFLELGGTLAHGAHQLDHGRRAVVFHQGGNTAVVGVGMHTLRGERVRQRCRSRWRVDHVKPRGGLCQQPAQLPHHALSALACA